MNKYAIALSLAFFSALILLPMATVSAQNQTTGNQSAGTNMTGMYNMTSTSGEDSTTSESGQISAKKR